MANSLFSLPDSNSRGLASAIEQLMPFSSLHADPLYRKHLKVLHQSIAKSITRARCVHLSIYFLRHHPVGQHPPPEVLLEWLFARPNRLLGHFDAAISQSFGLLLFHILQDVPQFASLVARFFAGADHSALIAHFAWSTFPAVFGFFTVECLCRLAAALVVRLLEVDAPRALVRAMVGSYFFAMHECFDLLWQDILKTLPGEESPVEHQFSELHKAWARAASYLTEHHHVVFAAFAGWDMATCVRCLFVDILALSLSVRAPHLSSLCHFLIDRANCADDRSVLNFVLTTINSRQFHSYVSSIPTDLYSVDAVMSERDIWLIGEIVKPNPRFGVYGRPVIASLERLATRGYAPFTIELLNPERVEGGGSASDDCAEYARTYAAMKRRAANEGRCVLSFVLADDGEFTEWARQMWINETRGDIERITGTVTVITGYRRLKIYTRYLKRTHRALFTRAIWPALQRIIRTFEKDLAITAKFRRCSEGIMMGPIEYGEFLLWAHLAMLDWMAIAHEEITALCDEYFVYMTGDVVRRVTAWYNANLRIVRYLLPLLPKIKGLFFMAIGSRLQAMLEIFAAVELFDRTLPISNWQEMFEWVMQQADDRRVFESFAIWGRYIVHNRGLFPVLRERVRDAIRKLFAAFVGMLKPNPQLRFEFEGFINF
jgi:hypothetical protein